MPCSHVAVRPLGETRPNEVITWIMCPLRKEQVNCPLLGGTLGRVALSFSPAPDQLALPGSSGRWSASPPPHTFQLNINQSIAGDTNGTEHYVQKSPPGEAAVIGRDVE